jgi:hypothetical protein
MFTEKHRAGYPRSGEGHQSPEGKATSRILIPGKRTSPWSGKELNLTLWKFTNIYRSINFIRIDKFTCLEMYFDL